MANRREVTAELERLPWQKREALREAVGEGKAVSDPELAQLAVDYAEVTHHQLVRIYACVLAPLVLVVLGALFWFLSGSEEDFSVGAALFASVMTFTITGGLVWAVTLRPLARARHANLHLAGLVEHGLGPRDASHWVLAWFIAWPTAALVGAGLRAAGLDVAGPLAFAAWVGVLWSVKRALDDRASGST